MLSTLSFSATQLTTVRATIARKVIRSMSIFASGLLISTAPAPIFLDTNLGLNRV